MLAAAQFSGGGGGDKMVRISSADMRLVQEAGLICHIRAAARRRRCRQELTDRFEFRGAQRRRLGRRALLHGAVHCPEVYDFQSLRADPAGPASNLIEGSLQDAKPRRKRTTPTLQAHSAKNPFQTTHTPLAITHSHK